MILKNNNNILSLLLIGILIYLPACTTSHRAVDNTSTVIPKHLYAKENIVVKTTRQIKRGEIFTKDNIHLETIKSERLLENTIKKLEDALGYEAVNYLPSGKRLNHRSMKKPALGSKGEKIMILAEKNGTKITTPGILKEDGYENAMVQVLNIESKKLIYGRLVDANTVKVSF